MKSSIIGLSICALFTTGCASIVSKSDYSVKLFSEPASSVVVKDRNGVTIKSGVTPTYAYLHTRKGYFSGQKYTATFSQPGYQTLDYRIRPRLDGWYLGGNLVFGGLIGYLIVDPATGAMWAYPKEIRVILDPESKEGAASDTSTAKAESVRELDAEPEPPKELERKEVPKKRTKPVEARKTAPATDRAPEKIKKSKPKLQPQPVIEIKPGPKSDPTPVFETSDKDLDAPMTW